MCKLSRLGVQILFRMPLTWPCVTFFDCIWFLFLCFVLTVTAVVLSSRWDLLWQYFYCWMHMLKGIQVDLDNKWWELVWCFQELFGGNFCPTWMFYRYHHWTQNNISISFIREVNSAHKTGPNLPKTPQRLHKQDNKRDITRHLKLICPQFSVTNRMPCRQI